MRAFSRSLLATGMMTAAVLPLRAQPFQGIGADAVNGISADGQVVVGSNSGAAVRWTQAGGLVSLGSISGYTVSVANAASANGSVIVGTASGPGISQGFKWTAATGMVSLGALPGETSSAATAVSANGQVVVGYSPTAYYQTPTVPLDHYPKAILWSGGSAAVALNGQGTNGARAFGVNADGTVITGCTYGSCPAAGIIPAFRWTQAGGFVSLPVAGVSGHNNLEYDGRAVTPDGSTIVGNGVQAWHWTAATGTVGLGTTQAYSSGALAVSNDGSVIAGYSNGGTASRWSQLLGWQDIAAVLAANGTPATGWTLSSATGISGDGTVIVGQGTDPNGLAQGWVANIPINAFAQIDLANFGGLTLPSLVWGGTVTNTAGNTARLTAGSDNSSTTFSGTLVDSKVGKVAFTKIGTGTLTLTGANTYTGGTIISGGTLQIGNGGTSGAITGNITDNASLAINRADVFALGGAISGTGALQQLGGGVTTLGATNSYTGATQVNAGTLVVTGSIATSSGVTVASGATLAGSGTVSGTSTASGATLAPGNGGVGTLTVSGALSLAHGAVYAFDSTPTASDLVTASGAASLGGTLAVAPSGTYSAGQLIPVLTAAGGVSGTFDTVTGANFGGSLRGQVQYASTSVSILLRPASIVALLPAGASANAVHVAAAVDFALASTAPAPFYPLADLSGTALTGLLSQLDGEVAGGALTSMAGVTDDVLQMLASGNSGIGDSAMHPAQRGGEVRGWITGFGGWNRANGDSVLGSSRTTGHEAGSLAGVEYQPADAVSRIGGVFGLGVTDWGLGANGMGHSTFEMLGLYASRDFDTLYLSGAATGALFQAGTRRAVRSIPGSYGAHFNAQTLGLRGEIGQRFALEAVSLTPYAALEYDAAFMPPYQETVLSGQSAFALSYASHTQSEVGTELGAQVDGALSQTLFGQLRLGWLHDYSGRPIGSASFTDYSGSTFVVNSAAHGADALRAQVKLSGRLNDATDLDFTGWTVASGRNVNLTGSLSLHFRW